MNAREWMQATKPDERRPVLADAGTNYDYLLQLSGGHRQPSTALAGRLAAASAKHTPHAVMTVSALRPDLAKLFEQPAA